MIKEKVKITLSTDECQLGTDATSDDVFEYNHKLETWLETNYPEYDFDFSRDVLPIIEVDDLHAEDEIIDAMERFWGLWCAGKIS